MTFDKEETFRLLSGRNVLVHALYRAASFPDNVSRKFGLLSSVIWKKSNTSCDSRAKPKNSFESSNKFSPNLHGKFNTPHNSAGKLGECS